MRILYGVVGEGMGHATRSRVVIEHLLSKNHNIHVVVSGRAHNFLRQAFAACKGITIDEIHGLSLSYEDNRVDISQSLLRNLAAAPAGILQNIQQFQKVVEQYPKPDMVISDFESWAYIYGIYRRIPVVSVDNMQIINRCSHPQKFKLHQGYRRAKTAVKIKLPGAYHYVITSFFFPPVKKKRTTLVPPILRPQILAAKREPGNHILVYQTTTSNQTILAMLKQLPYDFRVYGLGKEGSDKNIRFCPFSEQGFIDDLRTARAVVASGGFSLMGEAVHLGVPMFAIPLAKQFEQVLNVQYLAELGYGEWSETFDLERLEHFLSRTDSYAHALHKYPRQDNQMTFEVIDRICEAIEDLEDPPDQLNVPSMGR